MAVGAIALLLAGCGSSDAPPQIHYQSVFAQPLPPGHHIRTVFVIMMENENWSSIQGSSSAPYINGTLLPQASYARRYYNPPGLHPSLPNYLWLEAGTNCFPDTGCIRRDTAPANATTSSSNHLVSLLQRAGVSWRSYSENISGSSCPLASHTVLSIPAENGIPWLSYALYAPRHVPFLYFADVTHSPSTSSSYCITHIRPFSELAADLARSRVARYNFITPNLCDDMHSGCPVLSSRVRQGDTWLSRVVPSIQRSEAYLDGGVIFILWDEGAGSDGPIGMLVLSRLAKGHGYSNSLYYTHSSTLRTMEEIFAVHPLLGAATHARDLRDLFRVFP